jgi:hypothetical protein
LAAFLKDGWFKSPRFRWWKAYRQWIKVMPNQSMHLIDYKFMNAKGEEVII